MLHSVVMLAPEHQLHRPDSDGVLICL